jgi:hypothetical protein
MTWNTRLTRSWFWKRPSGYLTKGNNSFLDDLPIKNADFQSYVQLLAGQFSDLGITWPSVWVPYCILAGRINGGNPSKQVPERT